MGIPSMHPLSSCLLTCLLTCLLACLLTYLLAHLITCLLTYSLTCVHVFNITCLLSYYLLSYSPALSLSYFCCRAPAAARARTSHHITSCRMYMPMSHVPCHMSIGIGIGIGTETSPRRGGTL